jgi:hypothetical protein
LPGEATTVELGRVLAGATPFKVGNINDTFRGVVWTDRGERTAIIKDLEPRELANEVLAAALGRRLGLPIPPACLAFADSDALAVTKGPALDGGRLVFASIDVGQPQVAMLYNGGGGPSVLARLAQWPHMGRLYGFDALVANIDRHAGNLLFSGEREVWLIDHGWCFTGPNWNAGDLNPPERSVRSKLREWLTPALEEDQRQAASRVASSIEIDMARLDLRAVAVANHLSELLASGDLEAVLGYLQDRCAHVPRLAAETLNIEILV